MASGLEAVNQGGQSSDSESESEPEKVTKKTKAKGKTSQHDEDDHDEDDENQVKSGIRQRNPGAKPSSIHGKFLSESAQRRQELESKSLCSDTL